MKSLGEPIILHHTGLKQINQSKKANFPLVDFQTPQNVYQSSVSLPLTREVRQFPSVTLMESGN